MSLSGIIMGRMPLRHKMCAVQRVSSCFAKFDHDQTVRMMKISGRNIFFVEIGESLSLYKNREAFAVNHTSANPRPPNMPDFLSPPVSVSSFGELSQRTPDCQFKRQR